MAENFQRAVGGGKTVFQAVVNGLMRAIRITVGVDGNSNRYDESICWYVTIPHGWLADFASVPLGTGVFLLMKGADFMDCDWWWSGSII